jgi:pilus assembly protein Flp/PilA
MKKMLYAAVCKLNAKLFRKNEQGATMVEYGLLVALIAVACVAILTTLGTDLSGLFSTVDGKVKTAGS